MRSGIGHNLNRWMTLTTTRAQAVARPVAGLVFVFSLGLSATAAAQTAGIDPAVVARLKSATDFLAAQQRFTVDTESSLEAVLTSGQKIEFDFSVTLAVSRPDQLRAERHGGLVDQVFFYDGSSLTLFNPNDGYYATNAAPPNLDAMLEEAREKLDLVLPAGDLIAENAYGILMEGVTDAFDVGDGEVGGVRCGHLAFRKPGTDLQIWIEDGEKPLIRKLVIVSTDVPGAPEFTVVMTSWDLSPAFSKSFFSFVPPQGAVAIDFLPVASAAGSDE
jgi:hypothetical protein